MNFKTEGKKLRATETVSKTTPAEARNAAKEEDPSAAKTTKKEIKQR